MSGRPATMRFSVGLCTACGKHCYSSKADAKRMRRIIGDSTLHVYRCPESGYWHLGHLPKSVVRGHVGRDVMRGSR